MIMPMADDSEQHKIEYQRFNTPKDAAINFLYDYVNGNSQNIVDYFYKSQYLYSEDFVDKVFVLLDQLYVEQMRHHM